MCVNKHDAKQDKTSARRRKEARYTCAIYMNEAMEVERNLKFVYVYVF